MSLSALASVASEIGKPAFESLIRGKMTALLKAFVCPWFVSSREMEREKRDLLHFFRRLFYVVFCRPIRPPFESLVEQKCVKCTWAVVRLTDRGSGRGKGS